MKESPLTRFASISLYEYPAAAGKARFSDRLLSAIQSNIVLNAIARLLAAGYLRSIDATALFAQGALNLVGRHRSACQMWEFRRDWRQWFEDKICAIARLRILANVDVVLGFYADMGYLLPPHSKEVLCSRLVGSLSEDSVLAAEIAELQKLPIGPASFERRILALDASVELHMAVLAHDIVGGHSPFDGVVSGGIR
jgi:hypothetical protein